MKVVIACERAERCLAVLVRAGEVIGAQNSKAHVFFLVSRSSIILHTSLYSTHVCETFALTT